MNDQSTIDDRDKIANIAPLLSTPITPIIAKDREKERGETSSKSSVPTVRLNDDLDLQNEGHQRIASPLNLGHFKQASPQAIAILAPPKTNESAADKRKEKRKEMERLLFRASIGLVCCLGLLILATGISLLIL